MIRVAIYAFLIVSGSIPQKTYLVSRTPVDVGTSSRGLCVAVEPGNPKGVWWWNACPDDQCSKRSSSMMEAENASVSTTSTGAIDVRFRLELIAREPSHLDVVLAIEGERMRGVSGRFVPIDRRPDLTIPEFWRR